MFNFRLRNAPIPAKVMVGGFLMALGLAYVYAFVNIAIVVGLKPKDIAVHYYGAEATIQEKAAAGEESLDLDNMGSTETATIGPRPNFKNLVQEGHFHLFGMTSFFFGLTLLGLFTSLPQFWKTILVGVPYIAVIMDNLSFMATRFLGPQFSYLTAVSGAFMGITFTALWFSILIEILKKGEATK